jgi:hypothetical protein
MTLIASVLLVLAGAAAAAQQGPPPTATGFAGFWTFDVPGQLVLTVEAGAVKGELIQGPNKMPLADATISGDSITFTVKSPDGDRTVTFTGTLRGDEITFARKTVVREGGNPGGAGIVGANGPPEVVAKRAKPDEDVWSGMVRNAPTPRNATPNPQPRNVTVAIRRTPDPQWRWRGGDKDQTTRVFTLPNQTFTVNGFSLADDRLTFSFERPGPQDEVNCSLDRQPDGKFAGRCQATGAANFTVFIELTPPSSTREREGRQ